MPNSIPQSKIGMFQDRTGYTQTSPCQTGMIQRHSRGSSKPAASPSRSDTCQHHIRHNHSHSSCRCRCYTCQTRRPHTTSCLRSLDTSPQDMSDKRPTSSPQDSAGTCQLYSSHKCSTGRSQSLSETILVGTRSKQIRSFRQSQSDTCRPHTQRSFPARSAIGTSRSNTAHMTPSSAGQCRCCTYQPSTNCSPNRW